MVGEDRPRGDGGRAGGKVLRPRRALGRAQRFAVASGAPVRVLAVEGTSSSSRRRDTHDSHGSRHRVRGGVRPVHRRQLGAASCRSTSAASSSGSALRPMDYGPGVFFLIPIVDRMVRVSLRTIVTTSRRRTSSRGTTSP
jgi:hypothetical protein